METGWGVTVSPALSYCASPFMLGKWKNNRYLKNLRHMLWPVTGPCQALPHLDTVWVPPSLRTFYTKGDRALLMTWIISLYHQLKDSDLDLSSQARCSQVTGIITSPDPSPPVTLHVVWIGFVCRNWSRKSAGPYSWPALVTHPTRIPSLKWQITAIHARSHMKCAHVMRLGYVLGAESQSTTWAVLLTRAHMNHRLIKAGRDL